MTLPATRGCAYDSATAPEGEHKKERQILMFLWES